MHFCEGCRDKRDWPGSLNMHFVHCEVCGKEMKCYQYPASELPMPGMERLDFVTKTELPQEWSEVQIVLAGMDKEINVHILDLAEKQKRYMELVDYQREINKRYYT